MSQAGPDPTAFRPHNPAPSPDAVATALRAFAAAFFEGAGPALTTIMNRSMTVTVTGVTSVAAAQIQGRLPLPWVVVKVPYARGLSGAHSVLMSTGSGLAIAHTILGGGDDMPMELVGEHEDAIKETLSQMLSGATATLVPVLARTVSFAPVSLWVADDQSAMPPELAGADAPWVIDALVRGGDGFQVAMLLTVPVALAREIAEIAGQRAADAPAEPARLAAEPSQLDLILDVTLPITVELGRARMQIQDVLKLGPGSVIELEKAAGDPVELYINDRPIAKGEVVVIDENFGVRLTSIVTAAERVRTLR
jgi:flagellar motor switch protein FliN